MEKKTQNQGRISGENGLEKLTQKQRKQSKKKKNPRAKK
jgi:hypothetical protein